VFMFFSTHVQIPQTDVAGTRYDEHQVRILDSER
jgi:hypothetical protein